MPDPYSRRKQPSSPQIVYNQPAEQEEHNNATPEYPLVLLRPPLHHANRIPTDPQRIRDSIQPSLRSLQHFSLLPQVAQHSSPPIQELIQLL
jgi:hypothetical protein